MFKQLMVALIVATGAFSGVGAGAEPLGRLGNQGPVLFAQDPDLPRQSVLVVYEGGAGRVPKELQGLSAILTAILDEGPNDMTLEAYRRALFLSTTEIGFWVSNRAFYTSVTAPPEHLDAMLALAGKVLRQPKLDPETFARHQQRALANRRSLDENMSGLIFYFALRDLFDYHPRVLDGTGSAWSIGNVTLDRVRAHHVRLAPPEHLFFAAIGPLARDEIDRLVTRRFPRDEQAPQYRKYDYQEIDADRFRRRGLAVTLIHKPGATDNQILFLFPQQEKIDSPGHLDGKAAHRLLGGGLGGELGKVLRTERGLTYHAGSALGRSQWNVHTFGGIDQVLPLLRGVFEVVETFRGMRLPKARVDEATDRLATHFKVATELPSDRLLERVDEYLTDLDSAFYRNYLDHLAAVTPQRVGDFVRRRISLDGGYLYVMGDKDKIGSAVREFAGSDAEIRVVEIADIR